MFFEAFGNRSYIEWKIQQKDMFSNMYFEKGFQRMAFQNSVFGFLQLPDQICSAYKWKSDLVTWATDSSVFYQIGFFALRGILQRKQKEKD